MKHFFLLLCFIPALVNAQSACNNQDFEDTTFTNWSGATGMNYSGYSVPISWTPGIVTTGPNAWVHDAGSRMTLITNNYLDSICIDPATSQIDTQMTSLAPGGGFVSARLGNANNNYEAEKLVFSFIPTAANPILQFQFATVMEDPGHSPNEQPFLMINLWDQSNTIISCCSDTIYSADPSFPFISSPPMIQYRRWVPMAIDLSAYIGQTVTVEFINSDCAFAGHFGYTYIDLSCIGGLMPNVWPGDCDYDLQANNVDLLSLGIAYGATGPARSGASNSWTAQSSADWSQNFPLGVNYKHSDCNGDGAINLDDTLAIALNYAQTHPYRLSAPDQGIRSVAQLYLVPVTDTVGPGNFVDVDIFLGSASQPVNDLYGLSFDITYNNTYVQPNMSFDFTGSFLGIKNTDLIAFGQENFAQGENGFALVRMDHNEVNGYGYLGRFRLATAMVTSMTTLQLGIANVKAINGNMTAIPLSATGGEIVINPALPTGVPHPGNDHFSFYPNPATDVLTVENGTGATLITLTDALGREVFRVQPVAGQTQIDVSKFAGGIYFLKVVGANYTSTQQVIIGE